MSALSDYLEGELLDHIFNAAFTTTANDTFVALFTATPSDAGGGTEATGGSYARKEVNPNGGAAPTWALATVDGIGYVVDNASDITFVTATASWGTITHFGIFDAVTAGNLLWWGALDASKTVGSGDTFKFSTGDLNLRLE